MVDVPERGLIEEVGLELQRVAFLSYLSSPFLVGLPSTGGPLVSLWSILVLHLGGYFHMGGYFKQGHHLDNLIWGVRNADNGTIHLRSLMFLEDARSVE